MGTFDDLDPRTPQGATKRCTRIQSGGAARQYIAFQITLEFEFIHAHRPFHPGVRTQPQATLSLNHAPNLALHTGLSPENDKALEATTRRHQARAQGSTPLHQT